MANDKQVLTHCIDWDGPVPENDDATIVVDDVPSPLHDVEERGLLANLDSSLEDSWYRQYLVAKAFCSN